ncbi:SDR family oxidoreductase [Haloactinomyces albus]|uniref:NAD(P)-dependent dehydrogenase (Short-subunit alcohol dehydrogenase family) n=1 Tax=Haloactinomyces albus TaxID=1352928 RepID=A0AAE3ZJ80_9ACTN|nr:SDR family oxidoreductase [Haloactinomyces albus]MDR7303899.1 NAD(P)-dependent dehydrogenase (short-subunit alcohol dehydrogenase family) [Haloactinomyces albus]
MSRCIAVTGAASGIGRALAGLLTEQGDTVIGVDLHGTEVCADLSTSQGRQQAADEVSRRCAGVLDALVGCAGSTAPRPGTVGVNYFGTAEFVEALRPELAAAQRPRVAVVGSISGTQTFDEDIVDACLAGDEKTAVQYAEAAVERGDASLLYPSSKVAVSRWLRRTCVSPGWADAGIPVNAVAPGVVLTPMTAPLLEDEQMRKVADTAVPMPLNGYAEPEVIARSLSWLVGTENTHITGQVLYVDGGAEATLRGPEVF